MARGGRLGWRGAALGLLLVLFWLMEENWLGELVLDRLCGWRGAGLLGRNAWAAAGVLVQGEGGVKDEHFSLDALDHRVCVQDEARSVSVLQQGRIIIDLCIKFLLELICISCCIFFVGLFLFGRHQYFRRLPFCLILEWSFLLSGLALGEAGGRADLRRLRRLFINDGQLLSF